MLYYYFNLQHPGVLQNKGPLRRFKEYSLTREVDETMQAALPFLSTQFQRKDLLNNIGR